MKKIFVFVIALFMVISLSACGKKEQKLMCKQLIDGVNVSLNVDFKGNMIQNMDFAYYSDLTEYKDDVIETLKKQDFCEVIKGSMPDYAEAFRDCKYTVQNKELNITAGFDVDKIAKTELDKMGSIEAGKESLEASGYTCEIK